MKNKLVAFIALAVFVVVPGSLLAHHGDVAYNTEKVVEVKDCVVTKLNWVNPHTFLMFDAKDAKGNVLHWVAEGGSPNALGIRGWTRTTVVPGDMITVYVFQSKSGNPVGRLNRIVRADGKVFRDSTLGYKDDEAPKGKE